MYTCDRINLKFILKQQYYFMAVKWQIKQIVLFISIFELF